MTKKLNVEQTPCFITHTNKKTHKIINESIFKSPLYNGSIQVKKDQDIVPQSKIKLKNLLIELDTKYFLEPETKCGQIIYPMVFPHHCQKRYN